MKFGSVPLKTYLPDGDVDLTVISPNLEAKRTWIEDVHSVLQKEIDNPKSEFRVTQVQLVSAEVCAWWPSGTVAPASANSLHSQNVFTSISVNIPLSSVEIHIQQSSYY